MANQLRAENIMIREIITHTSQNPEIRFSKLLQENDGEKMVWKAGNEEIQVNVSSAGCEGAEVFKAGACFLNRENRMGFPDSFRRENGMEFLLPIKDGGEFLAIYQHKAWWTRPLFGTKFCEVPERTQLLIRKNGNAYEVLLAVCQNGMRADLKGDDDGIYVCLSFLRNNVRNVDGPAVIRGLGTDPYETISRCIAAAKKASGNAFRTLNEKSRPGFMKGIGWCTWDSLGQNVSEQAILEKMEEFRRLNIPVGYVLIDDGWSDVNHETLKLRSLDADPEKFPDGIAGTVRTLKEKYHVKYVGVWQAFKGYWYGIEEGSPAHLQLSPWLMRYADGEITARPTPDGAFGFWNCWHEYLRRAGIDFVKVDGQGSVPTMLQGDCPDDDAMRNLYLGLEASVYLNFDGNLINCMGMAPENVWNRSASPLSRSSDDYTPTIPGSIVEHLLQNCYDNVWQGDLYLGDWDMFWSDHEENEYSAMLRVLSGGPVYVSDPLGHTNPDIIRKLISEDGSLLHCDAAARPAYDGLTRDLLRSGDILKIYNTCGKDGYLGCFTWDLPGNETTGMIRWVDIPAGQKPDSWLVYDRETDSIGRCGKEETYGLRMRSRDSKILALIPEESDITVIGIREKYIPGAAIDQVVKAGSLCHIRLNSCGTLVFSTEKTVRVMIGNLEVPCRNNGTLYTVSVPGDGFRKGVSIYME